MKPVQMNQGAIRMRLNYKNLAAGGVFIAIGGAFALTAYLKLRIGSALSMGPGYFPIMLGLLLALLGSIILVSAIGQEHSPFGKVSWRGVALVAFALLFFAFGVHRLGMAPSLAACVLITSLASNRVTLKQAVLVSLTLTILSAALFVYGLGLPISLIGPWLGGH
jgi:hypothetical protein